MNTFLPKEIAAVNGLIHTYFEHKSKNQPPRGFDVYHPSAFGGCLRQMQYQRFAQNSVNDFQMPEDNIEPRVQRIFDSGHSMHERWASYWEDIGILRGVWECGNHKCRHKHGKEDKLGVLRPDDCSVCGHSGFVYHEINVVDTELNFFGHVDLVLDFSVLDVSKFNKGNSVTNKFDISNLPEGIVVADMKTANARRFKSSSSNGPDLKYTVQLKIYCNLLDIPYGLLIYENKDNSDVAIFKVDRGEDYDWPLIKMQAKMMDKGYKLGQLPPPRPVRKDDYECKYCSFKETCHSSSAWSDKDLKEKRKKFYGHLM